jgi:two-component system chemotaxis sensor kinase CheA
VPADDIQQRVLQAFQQEHREHVAAIREILTAWPSIGPEALDEVFRMAHSMKGGARVCDLATVEQLTHFLEHLVGTLVKEGITPHPQARGVIERILDAVEDYMAAIAHQRVPEEPAALFAQLGIAQSATPALPVATQPADAPVTDPVAGTAPVATPAPGDTLRISAARLDRLLQSSGQLLAEAMRQDSLGAELREFAAEIQGLRLRCESGDTHPEHGFPAWRSESILDDVQRSLGTFLRRLRRLRGMQQQGARSLRSLGEQLQTHVRNARMVPASSIFEGFPKMVRDLARTEGKEVDFSMTGLEREADRLVLQALKDPVMHVLRNAVSHGIEPPPERQRHGKQGEGRVQLAVEVIGNQLHIRIEDDGRGFNFSSIRERAVSAGLIQKDVRLTGEETLELLFRPGFSTARSVTHISGRGMGLSVVKEAASRLQGSVRMESRSPAGSRLEIIAPLTAVTHRLLLVQSGGEVYALPARAITKLRRIRTGEVKDVDGKATVWHDGEPILLASLASSLGLADPALAAENAMLKVVVMSLADRVIGVGVDDFIREVNTLVQPLPFPASASLLFSGGVVLEEGSVALVLNAAELVERFRGGALQHRGNAGAPTKPRAKKAVLVVDDSFTARTLQKSILETEGYDVRIAVDGIQALSALRAGHFDVVVTDVQMPRMDGFQLLAEIKGDPRLRETPVILVTSLNSESDQARGLELGADAYIVKQRFDHRELIDVVRQMV